MTNAELPTYLWCQPLSYTITEIEDCISSATSSAVVQLQQQSKSLHLTGNGQ